MLIVTQRQTTGSVPNGIEFDWDDANMSHIAEHGVTPEEAVQVLENDPVDLDYQLVEGRRAMGRGWRH